MRRCLKMMIVLIAVVFAAVPLVLVRERPVQVRTRVYIRVPLVLHPLNTEAENENKEFIRGQALLVRSRPVLNAALSRPEVAELGVVQEQDDPVGWLEREIRVDFNLAREIMGISMLGRNGEELKTIVSAVCESYLNVACTSGRRWVALFEDTVVTPLPWKTYLLRFAAGRSVSQQEVVE